MSHTTHPLIEWKNIALRNVQRRSPDTDHPLPRLTHGVVNVVYRIGGPAGPQKQIRQSGSHEVNRRPRQLIVEIRQSSQSLRRFNEEAQMFLRVPVTRVAISSNLAKPHAHGMELSSMLAQRGI